MAYVKPPRATGRGTYDSEVSAKLGDDERRARKSARDKAYRAAHGAEISASKKAWYAANRDAVAAQHSAYSERHRKEDAARHKAWYTANREKAAAQQRAYREANREETATWQRSYREANRERLSARHKVWYAANRESVIERSAEWARANREKCNEAAHRWIRKNPDRVAAYRSGRRSKALSAVDREKSTLWRKRIKNDPCHYCGVTEGEFHVDHYMPLSKGGTDHWMNLVRACASCNRRKGATMGSEFEARGAKS